MGFIKGIIDNVTGESQRKQGQQALDMQGRLTDQQIKMLSQLFPGMLRNAQGGFDMAAQYDPHQETERAMTAFDEAANASVASDYGNARVPTSLRGLGGSTEATGAKQLVGAQRSQARGKLAADMTLGEKDRKAQMLSNSQNIGAQALGAPASLQGPANSYGQSAGLHFGMASGADPAGFLSGIGNVVKGLKLPWKH